MSGGKGPKNSSPGKRHQGKNHPNDNNKRQNQNQRGKSPHGKGKGKGGDKDAYNRAVTEVLDTNPKLKALFEKAFAKLEESLKKKKGGWVSLPTKQTEHRKKDKRVFLIM